MQVRIVHEKTCSNLGEPLGCLDWFHWSSPAADWHISTTQASPPFSATASAEVIGGKSWGRTNHLWGRGVTRPLKLTQNAPETMAGERPNLGSRIGATKHQFSGANLLLVSGNRLLMIPWFDFLEANEIAKRCQMTGLESADEKQCWISSFSCNTWKTCTVGWRAKIDSHEKFNRFCSWGITTIPEIALPL